MSRRLLARMHSYSRRTRRGGVEPATAQDFMRFLLRWQHVAPGHAAGGRGRPAHGGRAAAGLRRRRGGVGTRPARRRACAATTPRGSTGCATTARSPGCAPTRRRATSTLPAVAPSKATPISLVARVDLPWLLMAARAGGDPGEPVVGATAEVIEVLRERGACFAGELGAATNRLPEDIERALWDGVARGLVMSDGFGAIRARVIAARATVAPRAAGSRASARRRARHRRRRALVAGAHRRGGRTERPRGGRPRRARRSGGRAAAAPVGRAVPRPGGARLVPVPVARPAVGAAPARRPRPGARRPLRERVQRRAVRAARPRTSSSPRSAPVADGAASGSPSTPPIRSTWSA